MPQRSRVLVCALAILVGGCGGGAEPASAPPLTATGPAPATETTATAPAGPSAESPTTTRSATTTGAPPASTRPAVTSPATGTTGPTPPTPATVASPMESTTSTAAASAATSGPTTTGHPSGPNDVPTAVVRDVTTGEDVDLRTLIPSEKPILFWFWAPH